MIPKPLKDLENFFRKFPGIGPRQASRFSFFVLKQPKEEQKKFIAALQSLNQNVELCESCYLPKELGEVKCAICADKKRDSNLIYVVEKESDAINLEQPRIHSGVYYVLGQTLSPVGEDEAPKQRLNNLIKRLKDQKQTSEVVLALNNTREGNFSTMYIKKLFGENGLKNVKLTSLGRGLSTGSELEYADEETLRHALKNRS